MARFLVWNSHNVVLYDVVVQCVQIRIFGNVPYLKLQKEKMKLMKKLKARGVYSNIIVIIVD